MEAAAGKTKEESKEIESAAFGAGSGTKKDVQPEPVSEVSAPKPKDGEVSEKPKSSSGLGAIAGAVAGAVGVAGGAAAAVGLSGSHDKKEPEASSKKDVAVEKKDVAVEKKEVPKAESGIGGSITDAGKSAAGAIGISGGKDTKEKPEAVSEKPGLSLSKPELETKKEDAVPKALSSDEPKSSSGIDAFLGSSDAGLTGAVGIPTGTTALSDVGSHKEKVDSSVKDVEKPKGESS